MKPTPLTPLTREQQTYAAEGTRMVHELAAVFARQWRSIPASDFVSVGHTQVVRAAQLFDPSPGAFEHYLRPALHGAMMDLVDREKFRVQRLARHLARSQQEDPRAEWSGDDMLRAPTSDTEQDIDTLCAQAVDIVAATLGGGSRQITNEEEGLIDGIDPRAILAKIRSIVSQLDGPDRSFVHWYYEEELTIGAIARRLKVARRTVFRMQERVREKLVHVLGVESSPERAPNGAGPEGKANGGRVRRNATAAVAVAAAAAAEDGPPTRRMSGVGGRTNARGKPKVEGP